LNTLTFCRYCTISLTDFLYREYGCWSLYKCASSVCWRLITTPCFQGNKSGCLTVTLITLYLPTTGWKTLNLPCDSCMNCSYLGCQEVFSRLVCYYPTTPTDHPSTTRGTSVGLPLTVNIDIFLYLRFLNIAFV
jgi:hypothetical protein